MTHPIERELEELAKEISHRYGAPVAIVLGDTSESDVPRGDGATRPATLP